MGLTLKVLLAVALGSRALFALSARKQEAFFLSLCGRRERAIFESKKDEYWIGRLDNYVTIKLRSDQNLRNLSADVLLGRVEGGRSSRHWFPRGDIMDPVKKIKDHIVALNDVSFEDDVRLERYLSTLRALLIRLFGAHSQYMTYLNSVRFHPVSAAAPLEEGVRSWASAKKQVRDLLFVLLDDPVIRGYESWDEREIDQGASGTVAAAERIVQNAERQSACSRRKDVSASLGDVVRAFRNKVRVDMSLAEQINNRAFAERPREDERLLPRVRIDLTQLDFLHDGVEPYLVHRSVYLPKNRFRKALVVLSSDLSLNQKVRGALAATELSLVETDQRSLLAHGLPLQEEGEPLWETAILILSSSSQEMVSGDHAGRPFRELSVSASFQAGYLTARLGPGRVFIVFEGDEETLRPSGLLGLRHIPLNSSGGWRNDLLFSLKGIGVKVKDEAQPFFYAG